MKIQCDACEGAVATVVCCADEAALCARCDVEIHAANKLASKHQRLPLEALSARLPRCDVCQEKAAFIFCVEDRALFCRDCDEPIHVPGTLSGNHQRYLATGIRVGLGSVSTCNGADSGGTHDADHPAPPKATVEQTPSQTTASAPVQQVPSPPEFLPQGWAVDELLQFSDYESGDKLQKESPLGFRELEWFDDIELFQDQVPKVGRTAAEVPELFAFQAASDAAYYRPSKGAVAATGMRQTKKPRIEVPDDEDDYLIVPDLG
ncbi:B-box zinc finger protein 24-like [Phragmites australis]|uniref:B-box zinc finger protein 24-like n=1 Tax=Phragmites australis TaxID=29695 RepID=UPI002D76A84B|nr:B-box zinc finger protein 24-like [Phragmites australis]